ncbi:MAG: acetate--CoA ligase family protein [Rhizobiales bacterium]|nr:acetate--CoA ligase family protein [Hyphomicrobiales bacterium]
MTQTLSEVLHKARAMGVEALDEPSGKNVLKSAGINVPNSVVVKIGDDVAAAVSDLRAPLALKVVATGVVHKSDVGGVKLNIQDAAAAAEAASDLRTAMKAKGIEPDAWLFEEMAPRGAEVVVGGTMDPEFGPMIMVGLGGIFVEVLKDIAFRICPIRERDAYEMLSELKGAAVLKGARGSEPVNIEAIVDVLLRVGGDDGILMRGTSELAEIDINPLIVSKHAAVAVDARFILRKEKVIDVHA